MKIRLLTILMILSMGIFINSCKVESPTYVQDDDDIFVEFITLNPQNWIPVSKVNYRWYQQFALPANAGNYDYNAILVYYLNEHNSWEALPSTRMFWLADGTVYTDEIWYSHDDQYLFIDYRNTIPNNPSYPKDAMRIKVVYFNNYKN